MEASMAAGAATDLDLPKSYDEEQEVPRYLNEAADVIKKPLNVDQKNALTNLCLVIEKLLTHFDRHPARWTQVMN